MVKTEMKIKTSWMAQLLYGADTGHRPPRGAPSNSTGRGDLKFRRGGATSNIDGAGRGDLKFGGAGQGFL